MIQRFTPIQPDGSTLIFELPGNYILGTDITLFVNGQLLDVLDDSANPYGYFLNNSEKIFTFFEAPLDDDHLYVMYEDGSLELHFNNIDWTKKIRTIDFSTSIIQSNWKQETQKTQWDMKTQKFEWDTTPEKIIWKQEITGISFNYKIHTKI